MQVKELWGYIRLDGSTAIRPAFQQAFSFIDGRAIVQLDSGDWCYIDQNGQVMEPVKLPEGYVPTGLHGNGYVAAKREDGATDILNGSGEVAFSFDKGWIKLSDKETAVPLWEITSGDLPFLTYDLFLPRCGKLLSGMVTQSYGNRVVTDSRYLYELDSGALRFASPQMMDFSGGLAVALSNYKWGYVDLDGHWAIPPIFDQAEAFVDGFAYVRSGDTCGLISQNTDWSNLEVQ